MTNQVNKTFAKAAKQTQADLRGRLVDAFRPVFKDDTARQIDLAADWMGRKITSANEKPVVEVRVRRSGNR